MIDFARARRTMVDNQLRTAGITDRRLLAAMSAVPREEFVPPAQRPLAYIDRALPLDEGGRHLGAPAPFARLVQLADVDGHERVLDLGCGTGYSTAVLARLGAYVVAVEPDPALAAEARSRLAALGVGNVSVVEGELASAGRGKGPYDVIVIEGTLDHVPDTLFAQLAEEGRLVALIEEAGPPPVAHLFARSGKSIAARPAFDAHLPRLAPRDTDRFVF